MRSSRTDKNKSNRLRRAGPRIVGARPVDGEFFFFLSCYRHLVLPFRRVLLLLL